MQTALIILFLSFLTGFPEVAKVEQKSPQSLVASADGSILFVAEKDTRAISLVERKTGTIKGRIAVPAEPTGMALDAGKERLYVTCAAPEGVVVAIDLKGMKIVASGKAGHGARAPVLGRSGLYICNQYERSVSALDPDSLESKGQVSVGREPYDAKLNRDGTRLFITHHLPDGRADSDHVAAHVTFVDTGSLQVVKEIVLPDGSTDLKQGALSPDGRFLFVVHVLGRHRIPTSQLEQGWISTNALTVIDVQKESLLATLLLDAADRGAANPWAVACTEDGKFLCITHAGTHEISILDLPRLLRKLDNPGETELGVEQDLSFLLDLQRRVKLESNGLRSMVLVGSTAYAAGYFSDTISEVADLSLNHPKERSISLGPSPEPTLERRGEMLFNDATLCFQQWLSCATCHPEGRTDGLNWDLINDGIGNPKNVLNLLNAHQTPPAMSTGIRPDAAAAVRAGIRYILFAERPEEEALAIDAYLKSLKAVRSPRLVKGQLSPDGEEGKRLFFSQKVACDNCHPAPLYTDNEGHDVGTHAELDFASAIGRERVPQEVYDTPSLLEVWRTAPYLHDGRAATMEELFHNEKHGLNDVKLTDEEVRKLVEFVLSL